METIREGAEEGVENLMRARSRSVLAKQKSFTRRRRLESEKDRKKKQQLKRNGRGWLHFRIR